MGDPKSVDPAAPATVDPFLAKSIDPAAIEMLHHAEDCGIGTAFTRADDMKPCPIGESGACCRICSMGPCRLVGKDAEEKTGICGADLPTIASRHFARQVAGGVAAHSDHGRDMAHTLLAAATGAAPDYVIGPGDMLQVFVWRNPDLTEKGIGEARATGQAAKPDQFAKVRKNIARVKTVLGVKAS